MHGLTHDQLAALADMDDDAISERAIANAREETERGRWNEHAALTAIAGVLDGRAARDEARRRVKRDRR